MWKLSSKKIFFKIFLKKRLDQEKKRYILDLSDKTEYLEKVSTPELLKIELNKFLEKKNITNLKLSSSLNPNSLSFGKNLYF